MVTDEERLTQTNKSYEDVIKNIEILKEWSGHKEYHVIYDKQIDGNDSKIFYDKVMHHEHLYFIVFDRKHVFGHYHDGIIDAVDERDCENYLFKWNEKYITKRQENEGDDDNNFYFYGNVDDFIIMYKILSKKVFIHYASQISRIVYPFDIYIMFDDDNEKKRLVVIEMK